MTYDVNWDMLTCRRWPVWAINTCVCVAIIRVFHPLRGTWEAGRRRVGVSERDDTAEAKWSEREETA